MKSRGDDEVLGLYVGAWRAILIGPALIVGVCSLLLGAPGVFFLWVAVAMWLFLFGIHIRLWVRRHG